MKNIICSKKRKFKPFLILQLRPEDDITENELESILKYGNLERENIEQIRVEKNEIPDNLDLDKYSAIIVGGSPFDISTPSFQKSENQKRVEQNFYSLFKKIIKIDFPFLGACSGNGLLGSFLGTNISSKFAEPVGPALVSITENGKKDKLLENFPESFYVLLGHKEACDTIPTNSKLLITGNKSPIQMFKLKNNIYSTQFHPEGDYDSFSLRIKAYKNHGYFNAFDMEKLIEQLKSVDTFYAKEILRRFVSFYKKNI